MGYMQIHILYEKLEHSQILVATGGILNESPGDSEGQLYYEGNKQGTDIENKK